MYWSKFEGKIRINENNSPEEIGMLPSQLLRVRTRKGVISPLYCFAKNGDLQLARNLINQFEVSRTNKERKELLDKRLSMIECRFNDYKLVRGLCTLLKRRCQFVDESDGNDDHNILPPPTFLKGIIRRIIKNRPCIDRC